MDDNRTVRSSDRGGRAAAFRLPGLLLFSPRAPSGAMTYHAIRRPRVTIGRSEECTLTVDDDELSRVHASLERSDGGWTVVDNGSTNGVFVGGQRVASRVLTGGEVIRVGATLLRFFLEGPWSSDREVPVTTAPLVAGPWFVDVREKLDRAADSDLSVLITGESGTGKELIARHLHEGGGRRSGPFVAVNCSSIPTQIFESELFGHLRGAFTGASADRIGLLRQASGGTLFLDEVGDLPLESQAKLLRVLQERKVRPLGGLREEPVDVRTLCATNRPLQEMIDQKTFRGDLFARLAELEVSLPPLRARPEDIPALIEHFLVKWGLEGGHSVGVDTMERLCCQRWERNVRELESSLRRATLLAGEGRPLEVADFFDRIAAPSAFGAEPEASDSGEVGGAPRQVKPRREAERERLEAALWNHRGDVDAAAAELGISRSQLYRRAKSLGVNVADYRL